MESSIGKSLPHESAIGHACGTAAYIDDILPRWGELQVDFVGAPIASGILESLDCQEALRLPGVVAIYTAKDIPGHNLFGPIFRDEPFLVEREIHYRHQPLAVIAATDRSTARQAAALVKIQCRSSQSILTIDEAIAAESFIGPRRELVRGDVELAFREATHTFEGVLATGGQEQFYFETQACLAIPDEQLAMKVLSSTQNPTETQAVVAEALGLPLHQVICECPRLGGGFGGKETQSSLPAVMAALVAHHTRRSARLVYRRDQDMHATGKRHPYRVWYRVAHTPLGKILGIEFRFYSDGGAFADLSTSVMERTMFHADNAYYLPNVRILGQVCRTHLPPNTAFRGFGGPQAIAAIENVMQEIARRTGRDAFDVRRLNLYRDGDSNCNLTPYGQVVSDHALVELMDRLELSSDYRRRSQAISQWNRQQSVAVRGIAMSPIKFGISFTTKFLNQGNALVHVFTDGSVQVSSGGTEMGQGLNTKLQQIVAHEFGIDPALVRVMSTSTEKNHNTSPTAASAGTDLNGLAAVTACRQIIERMRGWAAIRFADVAAGLPASTEHIRIEHGAVFDTRRPGVRLSFAEFCQEARRERIDLGARGFYMTPGVDFNRETGRGNPFYYFTTGAAVSEVTLDRLTGEMTLERVDILMDLGQMINPGIDLGQVAGGFLQGVGWCTNEELVYDDEGRLLSASPTTYKIPNITDMPKVWRIDTMDNTKHRINLLRSKAVGEPPLMLGISVWLAIQDAIARSIEDSKTAHSAAKPAANSHLSPATALPIPPLALPATSEAIWRCLKAAHAAFLGSP
jgi:xanthine dehydrogenase large subunit